MSTSFLLELIANLTEIAREAHASGATPEDTAKAVAAELQRARVAIGELDAMHVKSRQEADQILAENEKQNAGAEKKDP